MSVCRAVVLTTLLFGVLCDRPLGRRRAVPVLYVRGSHYDVGFDMGRTFSSMIQDFLATYENLRQFEREYATAAGRDAYDTTLANMRRRYPYYVKEVQGIADGAKVPFHKLFLLQMDDLIGTINDNQIPRNDTGGCSSIGFVSGNTNLLGHTEDAFGETLNHFYIVSAHVIPTPEDQAQGAVEERFASLCYAGHLPGYTMGFTGHGLVFSINTLSPRDLLPGNTPRTFLTRAMLAARNWAETERVLLDEGLGVGNGFSVNMLWTENHKRRLLNVEVAPSPGAARSQLSMHDFQKEPLVHCNLYQRLSVVEVVGPIIDSSKARLQAIHAHAPPQSRRDLEDLLSDTSGKEHQVFQDQSDAVIKTIAAGIFDMERGTWSVYINHPNASEPVAELPIRFPWLDDSK